MALDFVKSFADTLRGAYVTRRNADNAKKLEDLKAVIARQFAICYDFAELKLT